MSLNATESELKRIVNDSTKPLEVRSEASLRLDRGFSDWPGRKGNRLGGYLFEPERFSQLDGWAVSYDNLSLPTEWPHELALPVGVTRDLSLTKANAKLFVRISVAVSPQWAQYSLLQRTAMSSALPVLPRGGIITGGAIGDVLDSDVGVNAAVSSGRLHFTRRNVFVRLSFSGDEQTQLDIWRLAREIDFQIREQGVDAKEWAELGGICPIIHEFAIDESVLHTHPFEKSHKPVRVNVEPRPGMDILLVAPDSRELVSVDTRPGRERVQLNIGRAKLYLAEQEPVAARTWLMACDRKSLLFSVAALDIEIRR